MKKRFFFLLWLIYLFQFCQKPDRDTVAGNVLEHGAEKPISSASVKLYGWKGDPLSGGNSYLVDSITTDQNGHYRFDDDEKFAPSMTVNARKNLYWTDYESERVVADGQYENTDIHLKPYAWLEIKVINKTGNYKYFIGPGRTLNGINFESWISMNDSIQYYRELQGNVSKAFQFSIWDMPNGNYLKDGTMLKFFIDSSEIKLISLGSGSAPKITPRGHDTTKIKIIF